MAKTRASAKKAECYEKVIAKTCKKQQTGKAKPAAKFTGRITRSTKLNSRKKNLEERDYIKTTVYKMCTICGRPVPQESSGPRVHKYRFHRNPNKTVVRGRKFDAKTKRGRKNNLVASAAETSQIAPTGPPVETTSASYLFKSSINNAGTLKKIIEELESAGSYTLDGGMALSTLMLQCKIALANFKEKIQRAISSAAQDNPQLANQAIIEEHDLEEMDE